MRSQREIIKTMPQLLFILLLLSGCSITNSNETGVEAKADSQNMYIINHTGATVYYVVFPRDLLASVAWKPCIDPRCHEQIQPHQRIVLPYAQFLGDMQDDEAIVYWWHLIPKGDQGYEMDELHTIAVDL